MQNVLIHLLCKKSEPSSQCFLFLCSTSMNYHFISIEGNIGSGKTTLAHILSKHYNARLVLEAFAENPFLPKFYENPAQFAFPLELFFMAERYKQLKELIHTKDLFHSVTISDYANNNVSSFITLKLDNNRIVFITNK